MNQFFTEIFNKYYEISLALIKIFVSLVIHYLSYIYYKIVLKKLKKVDSILGAASLRAFYVPFIFYIWLTVLAHILKSSSFGFFIPTEDVYPYILKFSNAKNIILIWWFCMRFVANIESLILSNKIQNKFSNNFSTVQAMAKFLKTLFVAILILSILPIFEVSVSGILAFGGGSAVVMGIAAKDILANYIAGFVIHADGNLKVGDIIFIETRDLKTEGHIEIIGWRTLKIRTLDQKALFIPNSTMISIPVANVSPVSNFRIEEEFIVDHQSKNQLGSFIYEINEMLKKEKSLADSLSNLIYLKKVTGEGLVTELIAHTILLEKYQYRECLQNIMIEINYIIDKLGIKLYKKTENNL